MPKKKNPITKRVDPEEICFPLPSDLSVPVMPTTNSALMKHLLRMAMKVAFKKETTYYEEENSWSKERVEQKISDEDVQMVVSLWQSINPQDSVEAALTMQFIVTHLQGIKKFANDNESWKDPNHDHARDLLSLSHCALEMLQKYRAKGAIQYFVQYNINKGQVVNIRGEDNDTRSIS